MLQDKRLAYDNQRLEAEQELNAMVTITSACVCVDI